MRERDAMDTGAPSAGAGAARTCVGCGKKVDLRDPGVLTRRVIAGPPAAGAREIAIDASRSGRGAHVHLDPRCIRLAAEKGLRRSFKSALHVAGRPLDSGVLAAAIVDAEDRRIAGMLAAAARSKKSLYGAESVRSALQRGDARLVVVATDARAAADLTEVRRAVAEGAAVAWGTKEVLARAVFGASGGDGVAVLALLDRELAGAVRASVMAADSLRSLSVSTGTVSGNAVSDNVVSDKQAVE